MRTGLMRISALLLLVVFLVSMSSMLVFANPPDPTNPFGNQSSDPALQKVKQGSQKVGAGIFEIVGTVGNIVAVILMSVYGLTWFFANQQTKTWLKEKLMYFVAGSFFFYGAPKIVVWLYNMSKTIQ